MISKKDKEILRFIETHKSITISICSKTVFQGNKWSRDQARKQLRQLYKEGLIQRFQGNKTSEVVYYTMERLGIHDLKLLDLYAELIHLGATITSFKKEYRVYTDQAKKKYRDIDAVIELNFTDDKGIFQSVILVEIDYSHYTSMNKLKDIYKSNHFQEVYGDDFFPLIVIVRPVAENKLIVEDGLLILYVDWELTNISQALE